MKYFKKIWNSLFKDENYNYSVNIHTFSEELRHNCLYNSYPKLNYKDNTYLKSIYLNPEHDWFIDQNFAFDHLNYYITIHSDDSFESQEFNLGIRDKNYNWR